MKVKKLLAVILSVMMLVSVCPFAFAADNVAEVNGTEYATLAEAVAAAESGDTVTLLADAALDSSLVFTKSVVLELATYTISYTSYPTLRCATADITVTVQNGTIAGGVAYAIYATAGTINLINCTITTTSSGYTVRTDGADLNLTNCTVSTEGKYALDLRGGNVILVNTAVSASEQAVSIYTAKTGGTVYFKLDADSTLTADSTACAIIGANATLDIYGTISATNSYAVSSNGSTGYTNVTINVYDGATLTCDNGWGIYAPATDSVTNIYGGTITGGQTGIEVRGGSLNIYGGTITSNATELVTTANGSGSSVSGAAVAVSQHSTNDDITVTISGGTLTGAYALYEADLMDDSSDNIALAVEGGTFEGTVADVNSDDCEKFITGGEFNSDVSEYVASDSALVDNGDGTYTIETAVATVNGVGYLTLAEAVAAAESGDTVTLLADVTLDSALVFTKSVVLDLGTHQISYTGYPTLRCSTADITVTVQNGTIAGGTYYAVYATAGTVNLTNCTVTTSSGYTICTIGADLNLTDCTVSTEGKYALDLRGGDVSLVNTTVSSTASAGEAVSIYTSKSGGTVNFTMDANSTATGTYAGITVYGSNATLNIYGTVSGTGYGIASNGSSSFSNVAINVYDGATVTSETGWAIYAPTIDSVTNIYGGTITGGQTGIEVRGGSLNIYGGTITSNATELVTIANGSGTSVSGAAVAVSQHSTNDDITVTISGGTLTGAYALYEADLMDDSSDNIALAVEGGTFEGTVADVNSDDCEKFITGGEFNSDVSEYVASGLALVDNGDGTYSVEQAELEIKGTNLLVEENIKPNVFIAEEQVAAFDSVKVEFKLGETVYTGVENPNAAVEGYKAYTIENLAAKQMADIFQATAYGIVNGETTKVSESVDYSIAQYVKSTLAENADEALTVMLVDMLSYGAEAQKFYGYNTDTLATDVLTAEQLAKATTAAPASQNDLKNDASTLTGDTKIAGASLELVENANIIMYVRGDVTGLTLQVKNTTGTVVAETSDFVYDENVQAYIAVFDGVSADQMRSVYTFALTNGETVVSNTVSYSIATYCSTVTGDVSTLAAELLQFGDSASAYFA